MTETDRVLTRALKLAVPDRARVAERLLLSLESGFDRDVESAWQQERLSARRSKRELAIWRSSSRTLQWFCSASIS